MSNKNARREISFLLRCYWPRILGGFAVFAVFSAMIGQATYAQSPQLSWSAYISCAQDDLACIERAARRDIFVANTNAAVTIAQNNATRAASNNNGGWNTAGGIATQRGVYTCASGGQANTLNECLARDRQQNNGGWGGPVSNTGTSSGLVGFCRFDSSGLMLSNSECFDPDSKSLIGPCPAPTSAWVWYRRGANDYLCREKEQRVASHQFEPQYRQGVGTSFAEQEAMSIASGIASGFIARGNRDGVRDGATAGALLPIVQVGIREFFRR